MVEQDATDIALFVRTSREDIATWDRRKIVDALMRETNVDYETAEDISLKVEKEIVSSGMELLTSPLIRELVNAKLIERGLSRATTMHTRLGFPLYDVGGIILNKNKENANITHSPEGTNLTLAEGIKKEYAILNVFSDDVGYAHMVGDIHIHNLGYIDRPYCCCQSLEYIKKYGLKLPNSLAAAAPAQHAEVLVSHMVRFAAALQGNFSGAIGWDAVNLFFSPYLVSMSDDEIRQIAQRLVYEFAQQAVGRGGQTIFTDIHLYWEVPNRFKDIPAVGPGGVYTGKKYGDYEKPAQRLAWAFFDVYKEGDAAGLPFVFPRPVLHITDELYDTEGHEEFLMHVCEAAAEKGNPHFIFDRNSKVRLSECCCLDLRSNMIEDASLEAPWKNRYAALQNISINLPRLAYKAEGDEKLLLSLIEDTMKLVAQAHLQKREFMKRLISYGDEGPLSLLVMDCDGTPFLDLDKAVLLIGMVGLNELVSVHTGSQLHQSSSALKFGLEVVSFMKGIAEELSKEKSARFILQQTPAESTPYRFARLDLKHCAPIAGRFVKGSIAQGGIYYTNSTQFNVKADTEPMERARLEGAFHPLIEGDVMTSIWLGGDRPSERALAAFIERVFRETENEKVVFAPDFTVCHSCKRTVRGIQERCAFCDSDNVEGIGLITGYFSKLSNWNKGKLAEFKDRKRWGSSFPRQ